MPGKDRTGPAGMGPMTGGARGFCGSGRSSQSFFSLGRGLRSGGSRGGRGWRNWFHATGFARQQGSAAQGHGREEEAGLLKDQAEILSQQLDEVRKRLAELESAKGQ